jgi:hypothetical protein
MNWMKKAIITWATEQVKKEGRGLSPMLATSPSEVTRSHSSDALDGLDQLRFTIVHVSNGTLVRMETYRPRDEYVVKAGGPRTPPVFIVKDGETVQDVIVRLLGIAALERE